MVDQSLNTVDLVVDEVYGGSRRGTHPTIPYQSCSRLTTVRDFVILGQRPNVNTLKLVVLKSSLSDLNWPTP